MLLFRALTMRTGIHLPIVAVLSILAAPAAAGDPLPARTPLTADSRLAPGAHDRCPVCAMLPARQPRWAAALTLVDGTTFYFCSNGCLLRSWLRPVPYLGQPNAAIDRLVVGDYFDGRPLDAHQALWVAGSNVIGPMGPALVALGDPDQLPAFRRRHGGQTIFAFDDLDEALWRHIRRRPLPPESAP